VTRDTKQLIVGFLGVAGVVVVLLGLFTEAYGFMLGVVIAIGLGLVSGLLAQYWDVPKWRG
jgi:uncharacterized membrane protein YccC